MRMVITTSQGVVVEVIEDVEEYELSNPIAQQALLIHIKDAVDRGKAMEAEEGR